MLLCGAVIHSVTKERKLRRQMATFSKLRIMRKQILKAETVSTEKQPANKMANAASAVIKLSCAVGSGLIGLFMLLALTLVGGDAREFFHLPLPGPVIGFALLAGLVLLVERFHVWSSRHLNLHLVPVSRLLVSHMGLLFVPAGVGIITQGDALRREWLPMLVALLGSTLIGLLATGWLMQRFGSKTGETHS
jgi:holin-like protein